MSDIVFLVESIDRYGRPYTLSDKLKSLSPQWIEHYNSEIIKTYIDCTGKKITFQPYDAVVNFDPNKKYYYFICLDHFNFDFPIYFQMLGKSKLKRLHDNNIPLYFAHDLETIPHLDYTFFVKQLEWLFLMRGVYSDVQNEIIIANAGQIIPRQASFIKQYFYNRFKFFCSPLLFKYCTNELLQVHPSENEIYKLNKAVKDRQFTCLNRTPRFHRTSLLHGLRSQGLIDEGYISYAHAGWFKPDTIISQSKYAADVKTDMHNGGIPILALDQYEFTDNRPKSIPSYPDQLWKSYYDIVSETGVLYFLPDPLDLTLLTEKTTKSILFMRPFMINGGPYCLEILKKFGFKTYDFMFDESYDTVENIIDRQEIIIKNVKQYVNKYKDLSYTMSEANRVASYNRHHLLNVDYEQLLINQLLSIQ